MSTAAQPVRPALLALALLLCVPVEAQGQDYNLCVVSDDSAVTAGCGQDCDSASGLLPTIADALEAVAALPDAAPDLRPSARICVTGPAYHHEQVIVRQQESGHYANGLVLETDGTTLCSDGSDPDGPLISWQTGADFGLAQDRIAVRIDLRQGSDCAHTGPGIEASGTTGLVIEGTEIIGSQGYAVASGVDGSLPIHLDLRRSHIVNCRGVALQSGAEVTMVRSEVVGCHLSPASLADGAALLRAGGDGGLNMVSSVVFGNLVDGTGLSPEDNKLALLTGPVTRIDRSLLAANVLTTGVPLVRTPLPPMVVDTGPEGELLLVMGHWLSNSVISRNRHVLSLLGEQPEPAQAAQWGAQEDEGLPSCAGRDQLEPYAHRPAPAATAEAANGVLFDFLPPDALTASVGLSLSHTFVVGNRIGEGPLVRLDTARGDVDIQLLQNTFADNGGARLLQLEDGQPGSQFVAARNLFVPSPSPELRPIEPLLLFADAPAAVTVTMNASPGPVVWFAEDGDTTRSLLGPSPTFGEAGFLAAAKVDDLDDCERFRQTCPASPGAACDDSPWVDLPCAVDEAAAWLPSDELIAALGQPWPWQTEFFVLESASAQAPGATGGSCQSVRLSYDVFADRGDGDGYPDVVDCDNDSWSIQPAVPEDDGYTDRYCDASNTPCYRCPDGSEPRPEAGDEGIADDGSYHQLQPGCHQGGCGLSYDCSGSGFSTALLVLLPLGRRRRR